MAKKKARKKKPRGKMSGKAPKGSQLSQRKLSGTEAARMQKMFEKLQKGIDRDKAQETASKATEKAKGLLNRGSEQIQVLVRQVALLAGMVKDAVKGDYEVPWRTVAAAGAALVYFVSPIDLIPDFLPGGYADDAILIYWVCTYLIADDLRDYCRKKGLNLEEYGLE